MHQSLNCLCFMSHLNIGKQSMSSTRMKEGHDFQMMWKEDKVRRGLMIAMHEHEHLMLHGQWMHKEKFLVM
jgi:hypothetical protein